MGRFVYKKGKSINTIDTKKRYSVTFLLPKINGLKMYRLHNKPKKPLESTGYQCYVTFLKSRGSRQTFGGLGKRQRVCKGYESSRFGEKRISQPRSPKTTLLRHIYLL
jgi:hypothetical protein